MVLAAEQGAPVRSIPAGRVIYADWLPGLGLLAIVDHGEGYLSLYGYNDQLRKSAGEAVAAGEVLAAAGDSGGRPPPGLYFEIRRAGEPGAPRPPVPPPRPDLDPRPSARAPRDARPGPRAQERRGARR